MRQKRARPAGKMQQQIERQTPLIKLGLMVALNAISFVLIWLAIGRPQSPPSDRVSQLVNLVCMGGLQVFGRIALNLLGFLFNTQIIRYMVLLNIVAIIPLFFGSDFIKQLYKFENLGLAQGFLTEATFKPSLYYFDSREKELPLPAGFRKGASSSRGAIVKKGKLVPRNKQPENRTVAWAGGPGKVVLPPENAVQLCRAGQLTAVIGPGTCHLRRYEKVYKLLDLRQIIRKKTFAALTRDGIKVSVMVTAHFRVLASKQPSNKNPYPFDEQALTKLVVNALAGKTGPMDWKTRPMAIAGDVVNEVMAQYRLDELVEPLDSDKDPKLIIQNQIRRLMRQQARDQGIEITEVWLGEFQLPDDVTEQYVKYWQTYWQQQDQTRLAGGQTEAITILSHARTEARKLVIESLVDAFQTGLKPGIDIVPRELVAIRLIDGLEQLYHQQGNALDQNQQQLHLLDQQLAKLRNAIQVTPSLPAPGNASYGEQVEEEEPDARS